MTSGNKNLNNIIEIISYKTKRKQNKNAGSVTECQAGGDRKKNRNEKTLGGE